MDVRDVCLLTKRSGKCLVKNVKETARIIGGIKSEQR